MDKFTKFQIYKIASILEFMLEKKYGKEAVEDCATDSLGRYLYNNDEGFREFIDDQHKENDRN